MSFNTTMAKIDEKAPTEKASGVRNRFERLAKRARESKVKKRFSEVLNRFSELRANDTIVDDVTPAKHQKKGKKLQNFLFLLGRIRIDSMEI